jgi:heterodisulfide reductase subunit A
MCSDPGQQLIREHIREDSLDAVIVAACSPAMHEATFRKTAGSAGVNPYQTEIANIREQASWVHQDQQEAATTKAIATIRTIVAKAHYNESLTPFYLGLVKRALVLGGGIAGMQVALELADAGYPVVLVERSDRLGGHMAELSGLYLNLDPARTSGASLLEQKIKAVTSHPNIQVLTSAELIELGGYVGYFTARVEQRRRDSTSAEWTNSGSTNDRAFEGPQGGAPLTFTFDVGAVVVATGYDLYAQEKLGEYGGGRYPDVIDGLQFEAMLRPDGPTAVSYTHLTLPTTPYV